MLDTATSSIRRKQTGGTGSGEDEKVAGSAVVMLTLDNHPVATAQGLTYFRFGERKEEQDTFVEVTERAQGAFVQLATAVLNELIEQAVGKRVQALATENSELRAHIDQVHARRKLRFRLPPNYWEEPEPP